MDSDSPTEPFVSVVIPLYNEGSHVSALLSDLKTALEETGCQFDVILVDDGSRDDTWERIKAEARARRCRHRDGWRWTTPAFALAGDDRKVAALWNRHCAGCESQTGARIFSQQAWCVVLLCHLEQTF